MQRPIVNITAESSLGPIEIRTAIASDFQYVLDRSYQFRKRINFIPARGLATCIELRQVFIAMLNNQPAGYILTTGGVRAPIVVRHNCVERELWRNHLGRLWMSAMVGFSKQLKQTLGTKHSTMLTRTRADRADQIVVNAITGGRLIGTDPAGKSGHLVTIWQHDLRKLDGFAEVEAVGNSIAAEVGIIQPPEVVTLETEPPRRILDVVA